MLRIYDFRVDPINSSYYLGLHYLNGHGVEKDHKKAATLFFECFNLQKQKGRFDYPEAAYYLGRELLSGEVVC